MQTPPNFLDCILQISISSATEPLPFHPAPEAYLRHFEPDDREAPVNVPLHLARASPPPERMGVQGRLGREQHRPW
jgi:hypothetical protein